jgi:DNA-binding LytR/AlgR family response regulator
MKNYKYIIIDDEFPIHLSIKQYFKAFPNYTCAHAFLSPEEALVFLQEHEIDLIFLDIEMPEMNGFQFLEALKKNFFVVILTAYPEKYSLSAHDIYLDKELIFFTNKAQFSYYLPKIIMRFEKMQAEKEMIDRINQLSKNEITTFPKKITDDPIHLSEILFITVIGHNTVLRMKNDSEHVFRMKLSELDSFLPASTFVLINRNTIVNTLHITAFSETTICIRHHHFMVSTRKQNEVFNILKKQKASLYQAMD